MVIQQYLIIINLSLSIDNSQSFDGTIQFNKLFLFSLFFSIGTCLYAF